MRSLLIFLLSISLSQANAQNVDTAYAAPYSLPAPDGWSKEIIRFPIDFAPSINYQGVEDLRFTPGWGNAKTEEYWTYAFLWYLEGSPQINETSISNNLNAYYTGLVGRNIKPRNIPENKIVPITVTVNTSPVSAGDLQTFSATVYMTDYMQQQPITLSVHIHVKKCDAQNRTVIFNEISPQPANHAVWSRLDDIWSGFRCIK